MHRFFCAALFVSAASFVTLPGALAGLDASDVRSIEACIGKAADGRKDACIGKLAGACLKADTEQSTLSMADCYGREYAVWDQWLNRDYAAYLGTLDDKGKGLLKEVERMFVNLKDKRCGFDRAVMGGGSVYTITAAECAMQEAARQWLWISERLNSN